MARISGHGVSVDLPAGWEADFFRRDQAPASIGGDPDEVVTTVVHLANWPLPPERGDFGGGAVEIMRRDDVLVVLFEYGPAEAGTALFSDPEVPWPLSPEDFDPNRMQRPLAGQAGLQRFFSVNGRPFCLYVVLGGAARSAESVPVINGVLATVTFT